MAASPKADKQADISLSSLRAHNRTFGPQSKQLFCVRPRVRSSPDGGIEIVGRWAYASGCQEADHETGSDRRRAACDN
jgi:hypothetical protein